MKRFTLALFAVLVLASACLARHNEPAETQRLAPKYHARAEVVLSDGSRADLVNATHAIEVEWADKWKESIGQSVLYSILTDKRPGVVLLVEDPIRQSRHIERCRLVCERLKIDLWLEPVAVTKQPRRHGHAR